MIGLRVTEIDEKNKRRREKMGRGDRYLTTFEKTSMKARIISIKLEIFALINDSFYMLKKIIKTHTARLDYVDIRPTPTFLRNAVAKNRQRRVIASSIKIRNSLCAGC